MRRGTREWAALDAGDRLRMLHGAYGCLAGYAPVNAALPWKIVGVAMHRNPSTQKLRAYEHITKKFDDFVARVSRNSGTLQRGLIIHDRSGVEGTFQQWTSQWRVASSSLGRVVNLADVPLFADSRATRGLQAADLVAHAFYRYYSSGHTRDDLTSRLWAHVDTVNGHMHGLMHDTRNHEACNCPACASRRR